MQQTTALTHYDAACREIALAATLDEAKDWVDKAEALRAYARQAHNTELEVQVAEIKLRALRRLGELSAALDKAEHRIYGKDAEGHFRAPSTGRPEGKYATLAEAAISRSAADRAEHVAAIPREAFEATLARHRERQVPATVAGMFGPHVAHNAGENEWYTPPEYIEAARQVLGGIDLDPASSEAANAIVQATQFFSLEEDGLAQPWQGRLWLNPPYAQPLVAFFTEKLIEHIQAGDVLAAIVLVNNSTETLWFQWLMEHCPAMCFPQGRIKFLAPDGRPSGAPLQGQVFLYAGPKPGRFKDSFARFGKVR